MSQVIVDQSATTQPVAPPMAPITTTVSVDGQEKEWVRTPLGKGVFARILVTEDLSDTQIEKLRIVLDAMKEGE